MLSGVDVVVVVGVVVVVVVVVSKIPCQKRESQPEIYGKSHHPRQGNHRWRTPWKRSQKDQSLSQLRGL